MKIIACGCSFMTVDKTCPGTHLSEILAKHLDADLENYAKLGASNFAIRLQIEHAITQKPDLILIGFTSVDRIEIPIHQYVRDRGVTNIAYSDRHVLPPYYQQNLITTESNVISNFTQTETIKSWLAEMYDSELKRHSDYFIASGILDKLIKYRIPFVFTRGGLTGLDWNEWEDYEVDNVNGNPWVHVGGRGGIYHTTYVKQQELAQEWIRLVNIKYQDL